MVNPKETLLQLGGEKIKKIWLLGFTLRIPKLLSPPSLIKKKCYPSVCARIIGEGDFAY